MMSKRFVVASLLLLAAALLLVPMTSQAQTPGSGAEWVSGSLNTDGAGLINTVMLTGNFWDWLRYWLRSYYNNHHSPTNHNGTYKVPEPATMLLLGSGLLGVAGLSRLRKFNKKN